jgi:hypothetical protein
VRWEPGDEVLWRETWRGRTYAVMPVRVVRDTEEAVAVYLAEGTPFGFPDGAWPWDGVHPWAGRGRWKGHGILVLHRHNERHAIWHFWDGADRRFAGWYVNLQAPFVRDGASFDTNDHELDIWVDAGGSWRWKDETSRAQTAGSPQRPPSRARDLKAQGPPAGAVWSWKDEAKMAGWVRQGRFTEEEVAQIRAEGERVLAEWPFPTGWEDWRPDPSWSAPELPEGWDVA